MACQNGVRERLNFGSGAVDSEDLRSTFPWDLPAKHGAELLYYARGVVDSENLPFNMSHENLQRNEFMEWLYYVRGVVGSNGYLTVLVKVQLNAPSELAEELFSSPHSYSVSSYPWRLAEVMHSFGSGR